MPRVKQFHRYYVECQISGYLTVADDANENE